MPTQYISKIEEYLELVDTLKAQRFSNLLNLIRTSFIQQLKNGCFNPRIRRYFEEIIRKNAELIKLEIEKNELNEDMERQNKREKTLNIEEKNLEMEEKRCDIQNRKGEIEAKLANIKEQTLEIKKTEFCINFADNPKPIIQVKELINAMWQGEQALEYMENITLREHLLDHSSSLVEYVYNNLDKLLHLSDSEINELPEKQVFLIMWFKTSHQIYQAFWKITHSDLDSDFLQLFSREINLYLLPNLLKIDTGVHEFLRETETFLNVVSPIEWARKSGLVTGIVVDQMQPHTGNIDMEYITKLTSYLPSYIDKIANYIQILSNKVASEQPDIKDKVEIFETNATKLLHSLEHIKNGGSVFVVMHYIRVINHTINLVKELCDKFGKISETSQLLVKGHLTEIKYRYVPELLAVLDKIEITCMLKPGTITNNCTDIIDKFYQTLIDLCRNFVDLTSDDPLISLFDARSMNIRFQPAYQKIVQGDNLVLKDNEAKQISAEFFQCLRDIEGQHTRFIDLDNTTKNLLINKLKILQPYFIRLNMPLYKAMVNSLMAGWIGYLSDSLGYWTGYKTDINQVTDVLALESQLNNLFSSNIATYGFHSLLYEDLIDNACTYTSLPVYTIRVMVDQKISQDQKFYLVKWLANNSDELALEHLEMELFELDKIHKLVSESIVHLLTNNPDFSVLKKLYNQIQPHFFWLQTIEDDIEQFDQQMVNALVNPNSADFPRKEIIEKLTDINRNLEEQVENINTEINISRNHVDQLNLQRLSEQQLVLPKEINRAHYVFKNTKYSQSIVDTRNFLMDLTNIFNSYIQQELKGASKSALPFDELRQTKAQSFGYLEQPKQLLALKHVHNLLFHLEVTAKNFEKLRDDDYEMRYVLYVMRAFSNLNQVMQYTTKLYYDPYLKLIFSELKNKLNSVYAGLINEFTPYLPGESEHNAALKVALNALSISPAHLKALQQHQNLSLELIEKKHKRSEKMAERIESIIAASNSYFKLFLCIPKMYCLLRELRNKVKRLAQVTHSVVLSELETIRDDILGEMLMLADDYEQKLGLKPGFFSNSLENICHEYYEGLLEPLGLNSKDHITLATSSTVLEKRILENNRRKEEVNKNIKDLNIKHMLITTFISMIEEYQKGSNLPYEVVFGCVEDREQQQAWLDVEYYYKQVVNLLNENNAKDLNCFYQSHFKTDVNTLLREKDEEKKLQQLKDFGKLYLMYCEGLIKTERLTKNSLLTIHTYLYDLAEQEPVRKDRFVNNYIREVISQQTQIYLGGWSNLISCKEEYAKHLIQFLKTKENPLILEVKDKENIPFCVHEALRKEIYEFNQKNDYFKLEQIREVLNKLQTYLSSCCTENNGTTNYSFFENATTLNAKKEQLQILSQFVYDQDKSVTERIESIVSYVETNKESLSKTMLATREVYGFSFAAIKRYFIDLLQLLGLYTPEYKKRYVEVVNTINAPQTTSIVRPFFANQRGYEAPTANGILGEDETILDNSVPVM